MTLVRLTIPIHLGSDPEFAIDDATEAVGHIEVDDFDSDADICNFSPNGQHEYEASTGHRICKHCREIDEL